MSSSNSICCANAQACTCPVGFTGVNANAFSLAGSATAKCTCADSSESDASSCKSGTYLTEYNLPITVTKVDTATNTVVPKTIAFSNLYNCNDEGTCDYSVPYDCINDNTCKNSAWTDCKQGADKTCGFTVRDMTLQYNSEDDSYALMLQNDSLNSGKSSSLPLVQPCPFTTSAIVINASGGASLVGEVNVAGDATVRCLCDTTNGSACNYQAEYTIPITVTNGIHTETIAFTNTSTYNCADEDTCRYWVPYNCSSTVCPFLVEDVTVSGQYITLNNGTETVTLELSSCE